jgi:hypothetical protein
VANLASEWYDVRVLSFVWIRRGRFSCEKSTEETRAWVAFAVLFWLFSFLVIMKVGTLSDRRDGIIEGEEQGSARSLSLYNHITRSTIISPTCYLWVPALIAFTASRPDSKRRPHSHNPLTATHPQPRDREREKMVAVKSI